MATCSIKYVASLLHYTREFIIYHAKENNLRVQNHQEGYHIIVSQVHHSELMDNFGSYHQQEQQKFIHKST